MLFHIGDRVVARHNDRSLRTSCGVMVRNRAEWTVVDMDGDTSAIDVLSAAIARDWDDAPAIEMRRALGALARDADGLVQFSGVDPDSTDRVRQRLERQLGLGRVAGVGRSIDNDFGAEL